MLARSRPLRVLVVLVVLPATIAFFALLYWVAALTFELTTGVNATPSTASARALTPVLTFGCGAILAGWLTALALALSREPRSFAVPVLAATLLGGGLTVVIPPWAGLVRGLLSALGELLAYSISNR